jgi:alpha-amylase/alpha-mannosidase (GH57 family)
VRLHSLRDYYGMAALAAGHPGVKVTFNFSAGLLWQIEDYAVRGATDEAFELTLTPPESLSPLQRQRLLDTFFAADLNHQILLHPRYRDLFHARQHGLAFSTQDLLDLQMWASLAWFAKEFREGVVTLVTGEVVDVARFVAQDRNFSHQDVSAMAEAQRRVMRAIIPLHRQLQDQGQIEIAFSPFYHPILPLLIDSGAGTVDHPGDRLPRPFQHPEDAEAQIALALASGARWFGRRPQGMWPPEGAVCQSLVSLLGRAGVRWAASDQGVLARSGRFGYQAEDPRVRGRVYGGEEGGHQVALLFRDTELADDLAFRCHQQGDVEAAARSWAAKARARADATAQADLAAVTVVLDGENAWAAYADDGRPFLQALYAALVQNGVRTETPAALLESQDQPLPVVRPLYCGSWIDEAGSAAGVDLGTWIGEPEENRAWELLGETRDMLKRTGLEPTAAPEAYQALYAAEGSDWFWWFGGDQDSGHDSDFDELFRAHLRAVYLAVGEVPPRALALPIIEAGRQGR